MNNINEGLDPNNPAHEIVIRINNQNEELYGKYHSECGLFKTYCRCEKVKEDNEQGR